MPQQEGRGGASVLDDFRSSLPMQQIADVCQAVGCNTIPAWLRPYDVPSNVEKFRVELARRMLELDDPSVVDEFTSVVDRQVAQIGAHAVQKYVRKQPGKFTPGGLHSALLRLRDTLLPPILFPRQSGTR